MDAKVVKNSENSEVVQRNKYQSSVTLKNEALAAKIGVDTAVNKPGKGSGKGSGNLRKRKKRSTNLPWIGE